MLTVVFATYNRAKVLSETLTAMQRLQPPTGGWKLLVVNNGSSDETDEVLLTHRNQLPLASLTCTRPGKNNALIFATPEFEGDLIVFTDDDVLPDTDWLTSLRTAGDEMPEYSIFGGRILPQWQTEPQDWILEGIDLGAAYGITPPTLQCGPIQPGSVWGANMMVRGRLFQEEGQQFDARVGPGTGENYTMGSETEFVRRMHSLGHRCMYVPEAVVYHQIPASHLQWSWLKNRAFRVGRGNWLDQIQTDRFVGTRVFGVPRYLIRRLIAARLRAFRAAVTGDIRGKYMAEWEYHETRGMLALARDDALDCSEE